MPTASDRLPARSKKRLASRPHVPAEPLVQRCPFCHDDVEVERAGWTACRTCLARAHKTCWREAGRCAACGGTSRLVPPVQERRAGGAAKAARRDVDHEAHVRAVAVWVVLSGLLVLAAAAGLWTLASALRTAPAVVRAAMVGLPLLGAGLVACGVGLWSYRPWARTTTLVLLGLGLLLAVAQALSLTPTAVVRLALHGAWSIAVAWALLAEPADRIFAPSYAQLMARRSRARVRWWASRLFHYPLVVIAVFPTVAIAIAWWR